MRQCANHMFTVMLSTETHCFTVLQLKSKVSSGCEGDRVACLLPGFGALLVSFGTLQPGLHHVTFNLRAHMDMAFSLFLCLRHQIYWIEISFYQYIDT